MALSSAQLRIMLLAIKSRLRKKESLEVILASYPNLTQEDVDEIKQALGV